MSLFTTALDFVRDGLDTVADVGSEFFDSLIDSTGDAPREIATRPVEATQPADSPLTSSVLASINKLIDKDRKESTTYTEEGAFMSTTPSRSLSATTEPVASVNIKELDRVWYTRMKTFAEGGME